MLSRFRIWYGQQGINVDRVVWDVRLGFAVSDP